MTESKQPSLRLISGTIWMIGMRWSMRLAGFISTLILARVLVPEDFGVVAMAKVAVGLLEALSTSGSELALIRTADRSRALYDTAWTIRFLQRAVMALLLVSAAPFVGNYFDEPRTVAVVQVLAIAILLKGLINIGTVDFRKDLNFSAEFRLGVLEKFTSVAIAISLALLLRSYWALVLAIIAEALISVVLSYVLHPYRPKFSLARWKELWRFSMWLVMTRIAFFANRRTDQILVGGNLSTVAMGYYNFGVELGTLPGDEVAEPFRRSIYPNLSQLASERAAFAKITLKVFGATALFLLPIGFGFASIAPSFVPVILGEKWNPIAPVLAVAAIYGSVSGLTSILELPLFIIGKERLVAIFAWVQVTMLVPAVLVALSYKELLYVAGARGGVVAIGFLITVSVVSKELLLSPKAILSWTWRSMAASVLMYCVVISLASVLGAKSDSLILFCSLIAGIISYPVFVICLWVVSGRQEGPESYMLNMLSQWRRVSSSNVQR
jgi:O-antigen/teichoic acid export membrane protein